MPAPKKFYDQLIVRLIVARARGDNEQVDMLLDLWWSTRTLATEWDAAQWGFDDRWCMEYRSIIASRAERDKNKKVT
jgi:hypothetical protein